MTAEDEQESRTTAFRRNTELEDLLAALNSSLGAAENKLFQNNPPEGNDHPLIFVMGPLRSGTTLFMQWLADSGLVAYPTNLMSRFYGAPVIGAMIQLILTDPRYDFRGELSAFSRSISFRSENGKTTGPLEPNEFWYFWRRFLPFKELDWATDEELDLSVDKQLLTEELVGLTRVFDKPFALKGMILNYNIPFLDSLFEKALFIQLRRDHVATSASVLEARERQLGDRSKWYSFRIREYPQLSELEPIPQVVGQVTAIDKALSAGMSTLPAARSMVVQYEDFCRNPAGTYAELALKLGISEEDRPYGGPDSFSVTRTGDVQDREAIEAALSAIRDSQ